MEVKPMILTDLTMFAKVCEKAQRGFEFLRSTADGTGVSFLLSVCVSIPASSGAMKTPPTSLLNPENKQTVLIRRHVHSNGYQQLLLDCILAFYLNFVLAELVCLLQTLLHSHHLHYSQRAPAPNLKIKQR